MNYRSINNFVIRFFAVVALVAFSACDFNKPDADSLTGFQNEDDGISYTIIGFNLTGPEALSKVTTTNPFDLPGDAKVYLVYSNVTEVNPYETRYYMGTVGDLRGGTPAPVTIPVTVGKQDKLTTLEIVHPAYEHGVMLPCMYGLQFDDDRIGDNGYVEPTGLLQTNAPGLRRTHMNNWKLNYNENGELAFIQKDNMANMVLGAVYYDALGDSIRNVADVYGSGFCDSEKYSEMGAWDAPIPQENQMIDLQATYTLGYRTGMWYTNVEVNGNTIPVRWSLAPMVKGQSAYYALTGGYNAEMRWHGVKLVSINGGHPNMTDVFPLHHIDPVDMVGNGSTFSALTVTAGKSGYSQSENNLIYTFGTGGNGDPTHTAVCDTVWEGDKSVYYPDRLEKRILTFDVGDELSGGADSMFVDLEYGGNGIQDLERCRFELRRDDGTVVYFTAMIEDQGTGVYRIKVFDSLPANTEDWELWMVLDESVQVGPNSVHCLRVIICCND